MSQQEFSRPGCPCLEGILIWKRLLLGLGWDQQFQVEQRRFGMPWEGNGDLCPAGFCRISPSQGAALGEDAEEMRLLVLGLAELSPVALVALVTSGSGGFGCGMFGASLAM